jgi:GTPase SAR1 family protein
MLGPPGTGKTSLLGVMFGGKQVEDVMELPLKATRGYEKYESVYLGLELVAFDHAGQDISYWFKNPERTFASADIVVYMDQLDGEIKSEERVKLFMECIDNAVRYAPNAKLHFFINKMDRVKSQAMRKLVSDDLKSFYGRKLWDRFGEKVNVGIHTVSLIDGSSLKTLGRILNSIIPIGRALKNFCDRVWENVLKNRGNITIMDGDGLPIVESGDSLGDII